MNAVRTDAAVSPVIGILLMLVVTIIIAAVVSAFAGGLASDQSKAPQATFDVVSVVESIEDEDPSNYVPDYPDGYTVANGILFTHKGGDAFSVNDIKIQLQSQDAKTTVTNVLKINRGGSEASILPASVQNYIEKISGKDTFIKTGDKFMVYADGCSIDPMGPKISWRPEGAVNGFALYKNTKCGYKLIDKASDKVIQQGEFVL